MKITNLAAYDAAIREVCPEIWGVDGDGEIHFTPQATDEQITAAKKLAASYVEAEPVKPPPRPVMAPEREPEASLFTRNEVTDEAPVGGDTAATQSKPASPSP